MERSKGERGSYQRLEFLGDRVLGLTIAEMLYAAYPEAPANLPSSVRLSSAARPARGGARLGSRTLPQPRRGEVQSGGRRNQAISVDVCEAIIGAVP